MGLLKKEDGKYETIEDLRGPLSALAHSVQYLSPQQKQVLRAFMNRFANQYFKNFQFFSNDRKIWLNFYFTLSHKLKQYYYLFSIDQTNQ